MLALRLLLAALCLAAGAWLVVAERGARAQTELNEVAFAPGRPDPEAGAPLARRAGRWTPGEEPSLTEALLRVRAGDLAGATRVLRGVTSREPANASAWALLGRVALRRDPALSLEARRRARALVPPVPPAPQPGG